MFGLSEDTRQLIESLVQEGVGHVSRGHHSNYNTAVAKGLTMGSQPRHLVDSRMVGFLGVGVGIFFRVLGGVDGGCG